MGRVEIIAAVRAAKVVHFFVDEEEWNSMTTEEHKARIEAESARADEEDDEQP